MSEKGQSTDCVQNVQTSELTAVLVLSFPNFNEALHSFLA